MSKRIFNVAIEQENLVINNDLGLYTGNINLPKFFTKDFADNQIEFVSPIICCNTMLEKLYNETYSSIKNSYLLWPYSEINNINKSDVKIATLDDAEKMDYRNYLFNKHSIEKLLLCGIHFNFSFTDDIVSKFKSTHNASESEMYFRMYQNFSYFGPALLFFTSFTPSKDGSISRRNSSFGYNNERELNLDISNLHSFSNSIDAAIDNKIIKDKRELHSRARLKCGAGDCKPDLDYICANYIEIRSIDLNPLSEHGIKKDTLDFLVSFMVYIHLKEQTTITSSNSLINFDSMALNGRNGFQYFNEIKISNEDFILKTMMDMIKVLSENNYYDCISIVEKYIDEFQNKNTDLDKLIRLDTDLINYFRNTIKGDK